MSTNAEPDMDSVNWSEGSVEEWLFHGWRNTFASNQKGQAFRILLRETSVPVSLFGRLQNKDTP